MYYLTNTFSLNMLPGAARLVADPLTEEQVIEYLRPYLDDGICMPVIGHAGTAAVLGAKFGRSFPVERPNLKVHYGDSVYVAMVGIRLDEGRVLSEEELSKVPLGFWVITVLEPKPYEEDEK